MAKRAEYSTNTKRLDGGERWAKAAPPVRMWTPDSAAQTFNEASACPVSGTRAMPKAWPSPEGPHDRLLPAEAAGGGDCPAARFRSPFRHRRVTQGWQGCATRAAIAQMKESVMTIRLNRRSFLRPQPPGRACWPRPRDLVEALASSGELNFVGWAGYPIWPRRSCPPSRPRPASRSTSRKSPTTRRCMPRPRFRWRPAAST